MLPPLFAWAEHNLYHRLGVKKRIREVMPVLERYYAWLEDTFKDDNGLFAPPLAATMMENAPREGTRYPVDFNCQMALAALYLAELSDIINDKDTNYRYKKAYFSLKTKINALMWDERDGFYYDLDAKQKRLRVKTIAPFWSLIAEVPNEARGERLIEHLVDPREFGIENPFPTLAVRDKRFDPDGMGWRGSVFPPLTYMVIKGLEKYRRHDLAREFAIRHLYYVLDGLHPASGKKGSLYEAYLPHAEGPAKWPERRGFPRHDAPAVHRALHGVADDREHHRPRHLAAAQDRRLDHPDPRADGHRGARAEAQPHHHLLDQVQPGLGDPPREREALLPHRQPVRGPAEDPSHPVGTLLAPRRQAVGAVPMLADEIGTSTARFLEHAPLSRIDAAEPQLVLLAAGRGTRFGDDPKCVHPIRGVPLARLTIASFACSSTNPAICVVGYRADDVMRSLGSGNRYLRSGNPTGGTAWAALEAVANPELLDADPLVCIAMGDRIVPPEIFERIIARHRAEANDLTFLSIRLPPRSREGKGRVLFDAGGSVRAIREQKDIDATEDADGKAALQAVDVVNCPLYLLRSRRARDELRRLDRANAQGQYYVTDLVAAIAASGGRVGTETIEEHDPAFAILSCDLTRPQDVPAMERAVTASGFSESIDAARAIRGDRPEGQLRAIASQLHDLCSVELDPDRDVGIGIAGGRLRIAFMHPDMVRFYGPAWQVPIGSRDALVRHQIVALVQRREDGMVALSALNQFYRDDSAVLPAGEPWAYPGPEVTDWYGYEAFGTRMSRNILLLLGYQEGRDSDPSGAGVAAARSVSANMRRPFPLAMNALASLRTLAAGPDGGRAREALFPPSFTGLSVVLDGDIPRGGFSSSSAVTVATMNALNALFGLGLADTRLVSLACQAEFGTGVGPVPSTRRPSRWAARPGARSSRRTPGTGSASSVGSRSPRSGSGSCSRIRWTGTVRRGGGRRAPSGPTAERRRSPRVSSGS